MKMPCRFRHGALRIIGKTQPKKQPDAQPETRFLLGGVHLSDGFFPQISLSRGLLVGVNHKAGKGTPVLLRHTVQPQKDTGIA